MEVSGLFGERPRALDQVIRNHIARRRALAEAKALINKRLAPDFTPFDFVRVDEMGLSKLIGWLLNPSGSHGQGDRFLQLFLDLKDRCTIREAVGSAFEEAQVRLEAMTENPTSSGRLDIRVRSEQSVFAIENKPYADFRRNQVKNYLEELRAGSSRFPRFCLVVISRERGSIPEVAISAIEQNVACKQDQLFDLDYRQIKAWLSQCAACCEALSVTSFIASFIRFVERYYGAADVTSDELMGLLTGPPDELDAVVDLALSRDALLRAVPEPVLKSVQRRLAELHPDFSIDPDVSAGAAQQYWGIFIAFGLGPFRFALSFDGAQYQAPRMGLWYDATKRPLEPEMQSRLNSRFNGAFGGAAGRPYEYWISAWDATDTFPEMRAADTGANIKAMLAVDFATKLVEQARRVADAARAIGLEEAV